MAIKEKTISNAKGFTFIQNTSPGTIPPDVSEGDTWYNPDVLEVRISNAGSWKTLDEVYISGAVFGGLWTWGYNQYGQLGDGTTTNKSSPVQVGSLTDWSLVDAGWYHTTAIKLMALSGHGDGITMVN